MDRWVGKTAVVTGASAGIGAAICKALANTGVNVVGLARRPERVDALQSQVSGEGTIVSRKCDVSSAAEVAATFRWVEENFGAVHILINNAGVYYDGEITDISDDMISEDKMAATLDINIKGPVLCARHAVDCMKRHAVDGHIINISSIVGHYVPLSPKFNIYTSSKHAVNGFSIALLNELAHYHSRIKVTSLSPGLVLTDLDGVASLKASSRPGLHPQDVANAVLYVLSTPPDVNINELTITAVTENRI